MGNETPKAAPQDNPSQISLDSWKEIAAYLGRDVTTVQRWEKREGMPVHRHLHDKRGSVYALGAELDEWLRSRSERLKGDQKEKQETVDAGVEVPSGTEVQPERISSFHSRRWFAVAAVAAIALIAGAYSLTRNRAASPARSKIESLAVLPLKNLSGDPAQEYLADGMTEALIGRLARIHDLRVVSHTSVVRFKNPQISTPEIARALGVDAIVEGSVMREGNRIRVTAQLIRGASDEHFWSETYDRELRDVFALESEMAQSIADKVEVTVTGAEKQRMSAARPVAPEVYENYLKGRFSFNNASSKTNIEESISFFREAINKDPTFAPAYVGLAQAFTALGTVSVGGSPDQTRPEVIDAARKAQELDPNLAEAHALLANTLQEEWHWAEAEAEYRQALELNPNDASAHSGLALWLLCEGRPDEALAWEERGRRLDPLAVSGVHVAWIMFLSRHYDDALHEVHAMLAVRPEYAGALEDLGFILNAKNQPNDAIPALEKAAAITKGSPAALGVLVRAYAHAGRRDDALRVVEELKSRRKTGYVPAGAFVNAYLGLDDKEQAFVWLEQAYKEQSNILQFLKVHPYFDPIRDDPRFADLVRRVGLS